jgi:dihydrofolate reductase
MRRMSHAEGMMRKVIYGGACSLDGFLAASDGSVDWIHHSNDVTEIMKDYWSKTDTLVMGRKTWEVVASYSGGDAPEMTGITSYVFSRTLARIDRPGVELVSANAGDFVRDLKSRKKGKNIIVFGGGDFARSLFEADLIDEVGLNVQPVLLGSGVRTFLDPGHRIKLELTQCRKLHGGCVLLDYRVKHGRKAPKH